MCNSITTYGNHGVIRRMTESGEHGALWEMLREQLEAHGLDVSKLSCGPDKCMDFSTVIHDAKAGGPIKVVCLSRNLRDSVDAMGDSARDRVVMVRVDQDTIDTLDAWVETGLEARQHQAHTGRQDQGFGLWPGEGLHR